MLGSVAQALSPFKVHAPPTPLRCLDTHVRYAVYPWVATVTETETEKLPCIRLSMTISKVIRMLPTVKGIGC